MNLIIGSGKSTWHNLDKIKAFKGKKICSESVLIPLMRYGITDLSATSCEEMDLAVYLHDHILLKGIKLYVSARCNKNTIKVAEEKGLEVIMLHKNPDDDPLAFAFNNGMYAWCIAKTIYPDEETYLIGIESDGKYSKAKKVWECYKDYYPTKTSQLVN